MGERLKFCSIHGIAYNLKYEFSCPQCAMSRMNPPKQYDFDVELQRPLEAPGKPFAPEATIPIV